MHHRLLEAADEVDDILHAALHVGAQRPVAAPDEAAAEIYRPVEAQENLVADITHVSEPPHVLHDGVEFVTVGHQQSASIEGGVVGAGLDVDIGIVAGEIRDPFVVVSWNVDDT